MTTGAAMTETGAAAVDVTGVPVTATAAMAEAGMAEAVTDVATMGAVAGTDAMDVMIVRRAATCREIAGALAPAVRAPLPRYPMIRDPAAMAAADVMDAMAEMAVAAAAGRPGPGPAPR